MTLDLTVEEVSAIIGILGELPTKHGVFPLVMKIQQQAQQQAKPEENTAE